MVNLPEVEDMARRERSHHDIRVRSFVACMSSASVRLAVSQLMAFLPPLPAAKWSGDCPSRVVRRSSDRNSGIWGVRTPDCSAACYSHEQSVSDTGQTLAARGVQVALENTGSANLPSNRRFFPTLRVLPFPPAPNQNRVLFFCRCSPPTVTPTWAERTSTSASCSTCLLYTSPSPRD